MLQFVRQIPIRILIQGASSERRGFLFKVAAGFSKEVDPLSGMTVNLVLVDRWLRDLKCSLEADVFVSKSGILSHAFAEIMAVTRLNLLERAEEEGATLTSLEFREERSWSFSWSHHMTAEEMDFSYTQFMEAFPHSPEIFDLLKIEFVWRRQQGSEEDFQHEGFKILKGLTARDFATLHEQLRLHAHFKLSSGSSLQAVTIHHMGGDFSVQLF